MRGIQGANGTPGSSTIDVNYTFTGASGTSALVTNVGNATDALLDFVIPRGTDGLNNMTAGPQGIQGVNGTPGIQGIPGLDGATGATGATGDTGPMGPMNMTANMTVNMTAGPSGPSGSAAGVTLYFNHTAYTTPVGYEGLEIQPVGATEVDEPVTVSSGTGAVLIDSYITQPGYPGKAILPSGLWTFRTYHYVNGASGTTTVRFDVYNRTSSERKRYCLLLHHLTSTH
jgi:hypothetical protein